MAVRVDPLDDLVNRQALTVVTWKFRNVPRAIEGFRDIVNDLDLISLRLEEAADIGKPNARRCLVVEGARGAYDRRTHQRNEQRFGHLIPTSRRRYIRIGSYCRGDFSAGNSR